MKAATKEILRRYRYRKMHVKRGDEVVVTSGAHRGQKGKVLQVLRKKDRAIVEGVNIIKRHARATQANPKGGIEEREGSIHTSNLKVVGQETAKKEKKGKK